MTTEAPAKPATGTQIAEYSKVDAALADLHTRYANVVFDVTTKDGMVAAKAARAELRGYRTDLEKTRVEIKAPALERCRLIDAEAKRITAKLESLEDPIDATIKAEEQRKAREEAERLAAHQRRIDGIRAKIAAMGDEVNAMVGKGSHEIRTRLDALRANVPGAAEFEELVADAVAAHTAAIQRMNGVLADAEVREKAEAAAAAERAELNRLRAEAEERAKREAEERAKAQAEIEEEKRKAREQIEQEAREAKARQDAEDKRLREERERIEAERREIEEKARKERVEKERAAREDAERLAAIERGAREEAEAKERERQRKENERLDARAMLDTFVQRFGHLPEFAGVVEAISAVTLE